MRGVSSKSYLLPSFIRVCGIQLARKQSITVELLNVTDSTLFIHSKNICYQCLFARRFLKSICDTRCDTHLSAWHSYTYQLDIVSPALFTSKNTVKNSVQLLKLQMRCYVPMGFNRTHLNMLTISVVTAHHLNVNSLLSMSLRSIGIECDFVSKQWMDLIAQIKD